MKRGGGYDRSHGGMDGWMDECLIQSLNNNS